MSTDPYAAFERDVPVHLREGAMIAMAEAAHIDGIAGVTILDRDRLDAINCRAHGVIEIDGVEYSFQVQDGNWNGTELLAWDEDKVFEHHVPTKWALQPVARLVDEAITGGRGAFLLAKWDAMLLRQEIASIPGKYGYDRHFAPGLKTEQHWRDAAFKNHFDLVSEEVAAETRGRLAKATGK